MPRAARTTSRNRVSGALTTTVVTAVLGSAVLVPSSASAAPVDAALPPMVYHDEWPTLAADGFSRTSGDGWRQAEVGGEWAHAGALTSYVANGSVGSISVRAGSTLTSFLKSVSATDTDVTASITADKAQTGGGSYLSVVGRRVGTTDYGTKIRLAPGGTVVVSLLDAGRGVGAVTLPDLLAPGAQLQVRTQVEGTGPTTLRTKVWMAGTPEPAAWTLEGVAAAPSTQAGTVGVSAYVSGSSTDVPITYSFDNFSVRTSKPVPVGNYVPTSTFSSKVTDLQAVLDGAASSDVDGAIASWAWNFGDGSTGTGAQASHTYATAGTKDVTLTVTDDEGATSTTTSQVVVTAPNMAPVATILATTSDLKVVLDGSTSTDADGTVASYAWDFGDGTTGTGVKPTHYYAKAGTYTVRLTVTDNKGATGTTTKVATAKAPNLAPKATFTSSAAGLALSVDGSTSTDADGTVASYAWTFGDGATATGATATHTFAAAGSYTVGLTVTDNEGAKHATTSTVTVRVPNKAPVAVIDTSVNALSATLDAGGSSDADGSIASYVWTFGDGAAGSGRTTTHSYATAGSYAVTLTVTDNEGATSQATRMVTATVPAPVSVTVASDPFTGIRTNGWGAAAVGGTWTHAGLVSNYTTVGGVAKQVITTAGSTRTSELKDVSTSDSDMRVTVSVDKPQSGSGSSISLLGRKVGNYSYGARIKLTADGNASLAAMDNSTAMASKSLGAYAPGTKLNVRMQVTGTSPTTVRVKSWPAGTTEPSAWALSATSTTAGLQTAGSIGLSSYAASNVLSIPVTVSYSGFSVVSDSSALGSSDVAPRPTPEGMPGADDTGVPAGTVITKVHDGNLVIDKDGTVIDGWDIRGYVTIKAKNVVIRNSYVRGTLVPEKNDLIRVQNNAYSVTVEDSTLVAQTMSPNVDGIKGWNFTLRRVEISNVIDTVHIHGPNVLVEDSWLHDNAHYYNDPNWGGGPSHSDSVQIQGGTNITVRNTTIYGSKNAAFMVTQDAGAVSNLTIANNYLDDGACTINVSEAAAGSPVAMSVTGNTFGRGMQYANCAVRIPTSYAMTLTGNAYEDGPTVTRTNS